jgi:hypothetical protein
MIDGFQATLEFFDENAPQAFFCKNADNATRQGSVKR